MPYELSDPLGTGAGVAAAFLGGRQQAKDRRRQQQLEDEDLKVRAAANAITAQYKGTQLGISQQNADERIRNDQATGALRGQTEKDRVSRDDQSHKDRLMTNATHLFGIQQSNIARSAATSEKKWQAMAQIQATHENVRAQIASGQLKTDKEVATKYAAIDASVQNNLRTTGTSRANNENTVSGAMDRTQATQSGANRRADAANLIKKSLGEYSGNLRKYGIEVGANTAAAAAGGSNPAPFKPEAPVFPGAKGPQAPLSPDGAAMLEAAKGLPKEQRLPLLLSSSKFAALDKPTQQALFSAMRGLP